MVLPPFQTGQRYTGPVAESLKVPEDRFKAAIRALLNAPPMPASAITDKQKRVYDNGKPGPKKRAPKRP